MKRTFSLNPNLFDGELFEKTRVFAVSFTLFLDLNMETVLLHACCAPCSAAIIEWMLQHDVHPVIFYFNPNIFPEEEYLKRKQECIRYVQALDLEFVDGDYDHEMWKQRVAGLEKEPERGSRCSVCFKVRLAATALLAAERHIPVFTTTLTSSRWKSYAQVLEAGNWASAQVAGTQFGDKDWKKGGLTERRSILLRENHFYNQLYCGCEYSMR